MTLALAADDILATDDEARLLRSAEHGRGWRGPRSAPVEIAKGPIASLLAQIRAEDEEDLWKFAIVTADDHYIRNAELRALLREGSSTAD